MRFWLSRDTSIPIREQLTAQLILGILSRRFAPGSRLPSVRELARRLKIHANTVSAAYQDLARRGWVTRRAGAGVFVSDRAASHPAATVDLFVQQCVQDGLAQGYSVDALQAAFGSAFDNARPTQLLVVDPDRDLACIIAAEISEATGQTVDAGDMTQLEIEPPSATCVLVNEAYLQQAQVLCGSRQFRAVQLKSMQEVVGGQTRPAPDVLIGVASVSESILRWSTTLLSALGFSAESVVQRNARKHGWHDGLRSCDILAVDVVTAKEVPSDLNTIVFRIVSDDFIAALRGSVTDEKV